MRCWLAIAADNERSRRNGRPHERPIARPIAGLGAVAGVLLGTVHPALAHSGFDHTLAFASGSFATGFAHPWTGLDHLLALLTVGLWAGLNGGRALWAWPVTFVGATLAGGALGMAGVFVPLAEPGIVASVIILGLLVLTAARLPLAPGAALIVLFALLHGHAHGAELADGATAGAYMAGFALATALLHAVGIAIAWVGRDGIGAHLVRGAGAAVAAVGVALAVI
jgi:urease accessory protein